MKDLTTGPVGRHILRMSAMILVVIVLQMLYQLVDLYWVGRLGREAIAAVAIAGNLMLVVLALSQMLGIGTTALIAQAFGRREEAGITLIFNQSFALSLVGSALFMVGGFGLRDIYCNAMAADPATLELSRHVMNWFVLASGLQFPMVAMGAALRGLGDIRPSVVVQSVTVVLNMVLAPVLMFGVGFHHPFGARGAAMATALSTLLGNLALLRYILRHRAQLRLKPRLWQLQPAECSRILIIGVPAGLELLLMSAYLMFILGLIRDFGSAAQAGFNVGQRVMQTGVFPVMAVSMSLAAVAGQNVGARLRARVIEAWRSSLKLAVGFMLVFSLGCHFFAATVVGAFTADAETIRFGVDYMQVISLSFWCMAIAMTNGGLFQALGNTWPSLISSSVRLGVALVPAWLLSHRPGFDMRAIWWISVGSMVLHAVLSSLLLRRELGKRLPPAGAKAETAAA